MKTLFPAQVYNLIGFISFWVFILLGTPSLKQS